MSKRDKRQEHDPRSNREFDELTKTKKGLMEKLKCIKNSPYCVHEICLCVFPFMMDNCILIA